MNNFTNIQCEEVIHLCIFFFFCLFGGKILGSHEKICFLRLIFSPILSFSNFLFSWKMKEESRDRKREPRVPFRKNKVLLGFGEKRLCVF